MTEPWTEAELDHWFAQIGGRSGFEEIFYDPAVLSSTAIGNNEDLYFGVGAYQNLLEGDADGPLDELSRFPDPWNHIGVSTKRRIRTGYEAVHGKPDGPEPRPPRRGRSLGTIRAASAGAAVLVAGSMVFWALTRDSSDPSDAGEALTDIFDLDENGNPRETESDTELDPPVEPELEPVVDPDPNPGAEPEPEPEPVTLTATEDLVGAFSPIGLTGLIDPDNNVSLELTMEAGWDNGPPPPDGWPFVALGAAVMVDGEWNGTYVQANRGVFYAQTSVGGVVFPPVDGPPLIDIAPASLSYRQETGTFVMALPGAGGGLQADLVDPTTEVLVVTYETADLDVAPSEVRRTFTLGDLEGVEAGASTGFDTTGPLTLNIPDTSND